MHVKERRGFGLARPEERNSFTMGHRALFLDRDGTLVHPRHYPSRPADLQLYAGLDVELRLLQAAGFRLVVITNQAGIARGYFGTAELQLMHDYLASELAQLGVRLDGIYYCPHHPQGSIPELSIACDCRKPRPGMLLRAAADLDLDLRRSWFVGDILDDVEAGNRAGCRTILVDLGTESPPRGLIRMPDFVARDSRHALRIIASIARLIPEADLAYLPPGWGLQEPGTNQIEDGGWRMEDSHPDASEMYSSIPNSPSFVDRELKIKDSVTDADHERSSILDPRSSKGYDLRAEL